jgi:uroporphyrin-3 C-methyltransferase
MTQEEKDHETQRESEQDSSPQTEPAAENQTATDKPAAEKPQPSGGNMTALLALCIALIAGAGSGYVWWQQRAQAGISGNVASLRSDVTSNANEMAQIKGQSDGLAADDKKLTKDFDGLLVRIDRQGRQLEEIPLRIGRLEGALDNIPGVADKARSAWLLAEAEYFLRIGNAQLSLVKNADVALRALELADEKLRDLGDPGLTRVRAALADEIVALKAVPRPDTEGIVLTLGSLAKKVDSLPLSDTVPGQFTGAAQTGQDASGFQRAWHAIVDALMSIISVKRTDSQVTPLVTNDVESLLVRSLDMDLQIAQLALIRNDAQIYRNALTAVSARLTRYFDTQSTEVESMLSTINELIAADLPTEMPDISASLSLLLRLNDEAARP